MTRTNALVALAAILTALGIYNTIRTVEITNRVTTDEHNTCVIQSRGLGAAPYLVGSLDDLHKLLILPPTAANRRAARQIPRREYRRELRLLHALDRNLSRYVGISDKQPRSRAC